MTGKTAVWAKSVAQKSDLSQPLSPNNIDHPKSNTKDVGVNMFSAYPKTTPPFQLGMGHFSAPLNGPRMLRRP